MGLVQDEGLYKITVDDLARRAGLSKRTIYRYFKSKDEILEAALTCFMEEMGRHFDQLIEGRLKPEAVLDELFKRILDSSTGIINPKVMTDLQKHYPQYWVKIDRYRTEKLHKLVNYMLENSNQDKERGLDPALVSAVIIAVVQNTLNPDFLLKRGLAFQETARQVIDFIQYGLFKGVNAVTACEDTADTQKIP